MRGKRVQPLLAVSTLLLTCVSCFLGVIVILQVFLLLSDTGMYWWKEGPPPTPTPLVVAQAANPYPTQTPYPTHTPYPPCPACEECPATPTLKPTVACTPCLPTPTPTATSPPTNTPRPQEPTPTDTPAPTDTPESEYEFEVGEIDYLPYPHCDKNPFVVFNAYITDADGDPLGGYRLQGVNTGGIEAPPSEPSSRKWGYDIGFGDAWRHDTNVKYELPGGWTSGGWSIFVIDEDGKQVSPAFNWNLNPDCHNLAWAWFVPWGTAESPEGTE